MLYSVSQSNAALVTLKAWYYQAEPAASLRTPWENHLPVPWIYKIIDKGVRTRPKKGLMWMLDMYFKQ